FERDMTGLPLPVVVGATTIGIGVAVALVTLLVRSGEQPVDRRLATYFGEVTARGARSGLRGSAITVAQAVVPAGLEARLARRLSGAGMAVRPAEWVLLQAGVAVGLGLVGAAAGGPLLLVVLIVVGAIVPAGYLRFRHARRLAAFSAQL